MKLVKIKEGWFGYPRVYMQREQQKPAVQKDCAGDCLLWEAPAAGPLWSHLEMPNVALHKNTPERDTQKKIL